ncbi:MAG TPA: transcriptional repressor [Clostridia bacterium]|nr:transcriptional repressor [Clostridia bacterium]
MSKRKEYNTRQKELILDCVKRTQSTHSSAEQLLAHLRNSGEDIGLATLYRNLNRLVLEGVVVKYPGLGKNSASYQYIGKPEEHSRHYHLICLNCGRLVHLDCDKVEGFAEHIRATHEFTLDFKKTVFYGRCNGCVQVEAQGLRSADE